MEAGPACRLFSREFYTLVRDRLTPGGTMTMQAGMTKVGELGFFTAMCKTVGAAFPVIAPYQAFRAADGYVMIAAGSDALFARLAAVLGIPELARDPRFVDNPSRVTNRVALVDALTRLTSSRKAVDLLEALRAAGVPSAPILRVDQVMEEPQTHESGMLVGASHPRHADYRSIGLPLQWNGARPGVRRVPPRLGEHDADVLTWLGYTLDDIRTLKERGVLSGAPRK